MNGNSESSKDAQRRARQSRRQERRQARLDTQMTESGGDTSHTDADRGIPREPLSRLVAVINFLGSYNNEVEQIECALGDLLQKDERIKCLSAAIMELQRSRNEESRIIEEERSRLIELQKSVNDREASLKHDRLTLDEEHRQVKEEYERLKANELAKYEKAMEAEKKKLENDLQKKTKQNENATAVKLGKTMQQIQQLQNQVAALTEAKENAETTLKLFRDHTKELEDQQRKLESRYKTQEAPLAELEEGLSKIHQDLKAITHAYFGELPLEDSDIEHLQRILCDGDQIFQFVPLTASNASKYLRVRAAESFISKAICHSLWQPFGGSMFALSSEQIAAFVQISEALARQDRRKESLWRSLTFYALDTASLKPERENTVNSELARLETLHLNRVLRVMVPQQKQKEFEHDLECLITECVRFWNKAKRDSCIIEIDTEPPRLACTGWVSEPFPEIYPEEDGTEQGREMQPWCLFPRVTFIPVDEDRKTVAGRAVFNDSPALHEGLREIRRQKEEFAQFKRNFARRLSLKER